MLVWLRCFALPRWYLGEMKRFGRVSERMFVKCEWLDGSRCRRWMLGRCGVGGVVPDWELQVQSAIDRRLWRGHLYSTAIMITRRISRPLGALAKEPWVCPSCVRPVQSSSPSVIPANHLPPPRLAPPSYHSSSNGEPSPRPRLETGSVYQSSSSTTISPSAASTACSVTPDTS